MSDDRIEQVSLTFHYASAAGDALAIEGRLDPEFGWQQWGQPKERLGKNVSLIEALHRAVLAARNLTDL
jgi:hypothetical protein